HRHRSGAGGNGPRNSARRASRNPRILQAAALAVWATLSLLLHTPVAALWPGGRAKPRRRLSLPAGQRAGVSGLRGADREDGAARAHRNPFSSTDIWHRDALCWDETVT